MRYDLRHEQLVPIMVQNRMWVNKNREQLPINNMSDEYLENVINKFRGEEAYRPILNLMEIELEDRDDARERLEMQEYVQRWELVELKKELEEQIKELADGHQR